MKKIFLALATVLALSTSIFAAGKHYVIKVTDHEGIETYRMVGPEELKKLTKEAANEKKYWSKALALAMKDWKKKEEYKGKSFPRSCAKPMKITAGRPYSNEEDANKKLSRYEDSQIEKQVQAEEAAKKSKIKISEKKAASAAAKAALYADARTLLEEHLNALLQPAEAPAAE